MSISRCTQTPTFMEEWRKGWHPERMSTKGASSNVLVIGAGPAGLEAARAAAERGYDVALAETGTVLGGRMALTSSSWPQCVGSRSQLPRIPIEPKAKCRKLF